MPDTDPPRRGANRLRAFLWIFLGWTAVGVFNQSRPFLLAASGLGETPSLHELAGGFFDIYLWALLTPPMLWVSARFPLSRATWARALPAHVTAGLVVASIAAAANYPFQQWLGGKPLELTFFEFAIKMLYFNLQWYAIMVAIGHVLNYQREARDRAVRASRLEAQLARAQLQALRMQIQPHFLFNTINAISELVYEDARLADRTLMRLADLLRLLVDQGGTQEVSLRQELAFLSAYLEIQKTRFRERLSVEVDAEAAALDAAVPSLVLQPLVENAIQHGMRPGGGVLRVEVSARREGGALALRVRDNGPGVAPNPRAGVGVSNVRARLEQLYGRDGALTLGNAPEGGAVARATLPFRPAPEPEAGQRGGTMPRLAEVAP